MQPQPGIEVVEVDLHNRCDAVEPVGDLFLDILLGQNRLYDGDEVGCRLSG